MGGIKGAKFVKSSLASGMNGKVAQEAKTFAKPIANGFRKAAGAIAGGFATVGEHIVRFEIGWKRYQSRIWFCS